MLNTLTTFGFRPLTAAVFLAALVSVVWPVESPAQQAAPQTVPAADKQPVPQDVEALRRTVEEQGKRIAELESNDLQSSERIEQLEQSQAETQELMMTGESIEDNDIDDEQQRLKIYGFFDLTLNRSFWDKDSALNLYLTEPASFTISHLNLYVQAQLTDTLSSLVELKFSFSPSGSDTSWETGLRNEDGSVTDVPGPTYQRADATYRDPFTTENNRYGSVMIERVQLTWSPRDWMQFTVGRYLTPYGVWNVDYGSPVVLPVRLPYMQLRDMIMKAQTGIMAFGRVFPHPKLYLDYALTISNGSGRTEANVDFDDEKAFGLKLALAYLGRDFTAEVGGYAAYTTWADRKEQVVIDQYNEKIDVVVKPYDVSDELMVSAHAKLRFFGVLLQSEFVLHHTYYEVPPEITTGHVTRAILIKDLNPKNMYFKASYIGWGVYGLVAYTLPLRRWIGEVLVTPYVFFEKNSSDDTEPQGNTSLLFVGLNIQPNRFITLKAEWLLAMPEFDSYGATSHSVAAQIAVSF